MTLTNPTLLRGQAQVEYALCVIQSNDTGITPKNEIASLRREKEIIDRFLINYKNSGSN